MMVCVKPVDSPTSQSSKELNIVVTTCVSLRRYERATIQRCE